MVVVHAEVEDDGRAGRDARPVAGLHDQLHQTVARSGGKVATQHCVRLLQPRLGVVPYIPADAGHHEVDRCKLRSPRAEVARGLGGWTFVAHVIVLHAVNAHQAADELPAARVAVQEGT